MAAYTGDMLISAIKRNASIPTSQSKFNDTDFLAFLNEELQITMVGELISLNEDYFIMKVDTALVASQTEYDLPTTAIGWKLEEVGYLDSSSNYSRLTRINRSQRDMYDVMTDSSSPNAYYLEGNKIVLVPDMTSSATGSLRISYVRLQNDIVKTNSCGLISNVAVVGATYQLTVDSVPVTSAGVDIISGTNPFSVLARGLTAAVGGLVITVTSTGFERAPVAGDYIAPVNKTPIPNIPEDYHPALAQMAVIRCLISMNDAKGLQTAQLSLANMMGNIRRRSADRVKASPKKIVSRSHILNLIRSSW
jgi:hypothetical protein